MVLSLSLKKIFFPPNSRAILIYLLEVSLFFNSNNDLFGVFDIKHKGMTSCDSLKGKQTVSFFKINKIQATDSGMERIAFL